MRLIDADAFEFISWDGIPEGFENTFSDGVMWLSMQIDKAPTVDARPNVRGEWEQVVSGCAILIRCNQCKNAISENDFFEICRKVNHGSKLLDFCFNCGADMRGQKDER